MDKRHASKSVNIKDMDIFFSEKKPTKAPVFSALPPKIATFHGIAVAIENAGSSLIALENGGKTTEKNAARDDLLDLLHIIVPNLRSIANAGTDEGLKKLTALSDSDISGKRDTDLRDYANQIYKAATANATALADFGDDDAAIAQLKTVTDNFNTLIGESGDASKEVVAARKSLYALYPKAEEALKDIDDTMKGYASKDPDYYNQYILLRPVKALGTRHQHSPQPPVNPSQPTIKLQATPAK